MKKKGFNNLNKLLKPIFKGALENKIFSGATAAVFFTDRGEEKRNIVSFGVNRDDSKGMKINDKTLFDLASLTKPLCTALCIFKLIEKEKLDWDLCLKDVINDKTSPPLKDINVEQLLSHSAGLKGYRPYFRLFKPVYTQKTKQKIVQAILKEPLAYMPGEKCTYSDLGYIILGQIVENVSGTSLDRYFEREISRPLQLEKKIFFRPLSKHRDEPPINIAATEKCPWREKIMQGEVHDEHCWLMGGVAGHAGLFGTAGGVLALTEKILKKWQGKGDQPVHGDTFLQRALRWKMKNETWCLGFDRPSAQSSSAGYSFSSNSIGHLGYTGTSFWIDPEREIIVVLLTNRVHQTRNNDGIKKFRPLFHNTVSECLGTL